MRSYLLTQVLWVSAAHLISQAVNAGLLHKYRYNLLIVNADSKEESELTKSIFNIIILFFVSLFFIEEPSVWIHFTELFKFEQ